MQPTKTSWPAQAGHLLRGALEALAGITLFAMMILTTADVCGRYFFNSPILGAVELTQIMLAMVVFLAFPTVTWREEHITVDLLDGLFPRSVVWLRQMVINLICSAALLIMARRIWQLAERSISWGDATEFLRLPIGYLIYLMAIVATVTGVLCAILALSYLLHGVGIRRRKGPEQSSNAL